MLFRSRDANVTGLTWPDVSTLNCYSDCGLTRRSTGRKSRACWASGRPHCAAQRPDTGFPNDPGRRATARKGSWTRLPKRFETGSGRCGGSISPCGGPKRTNALASRFGERLDGIGILFRARRTPGRHRRICNALDLRADRVSRLRCC